jgi:hypothetical protein
MMRAGISLSFFVAFFCGCSSEPPLVGPSEAGPDTSADTGVSDSGNPDSPIPQDSGPIKCNTPNDCPDPMEQVCDPMTRTCATDECGANSGKMCGMGQVCVVQISGATAAACYTQCTPFMTGSCPPNQECVIGKFDGTIGYCKGNGGLPNGAMCLASSVETGCVPGDVCALEAQQRFCREQCDFWTNLHDCTSLYCTPPGVCTGTAPDPAAIGGTCSSPAGTLCGQSGAKLLGYCVGQQPVKCLQWCRTKFNDCPMNQTCQPTNIPSLGYCQ